MMIDGSSHDLSLFCRNIVHHLPEAVLVISADGGILHVNPAFCELTDGDEDSLIRRSVWDFCDPRQADSLRGLMSGSADSGKAATGPLQIRPDDAEAIPVEARVVAMPPADDEAAPVFIIFLKPLSRDDLLRESEQRYALAARGANDGLWDWNMESRQVYYSPRWKSLLGYTDDEITNSPDEWFRRVHPDDIDALRKNLKNHLHSQSEHFEASFRILNKQNVYRWVDMRAITLFDREGRPVRMCGAINDITQRRLAEEQLYHDAFHDALTGLPNRPLFLDRLKQQLNHAKRRDEYNFAILFLDLDRFKLINDTHGHLVGDQLLVRFAQRIESCLRPNDTVARLGGDEFAILLEDVTGVEEPRQIADRILQLMKQKFEIEGNAIQSNTSIGIAIGNSSYDHPNDVLRDADTAMYRAKSRGRSRFEIFDKSMHTTAMLRMSIETQMRRAFDNGEFTAHYQPLVELDYLRITGFEALARWNHPENGLMGADRFIRMAGETGLVSRIDRIVIEQSCRHFSGVLAKYPQFKGRFRLNVNVASQHLHEGDFVHFVKDVLANTSFDPGSLCVEISENLLKESDNDVPLTHLYQLRDLGISVCVDDFGTGYSSLNYIDRFPIDGLKIDRSFVQKITDGNGAVKMVNGILKLAETMRIGVVAEGVSSVKQLVKLREMMCPYGQGYLFSKPLDGAQLEGFLATNPGWTTAGPPGGGPAMG